MPNHQHCGLRELNDRSDQTADRSVILARRVQDVDELNQAFQRSGFSIVQLSPGRCEGEFLVVQMGDIRLSRIAVNCSVYTSGAKFSDEIIFATMLIPCKGDLISHKTKLSHQSLFGFDATREISLITPEQLDLVNIIVSTATLQKCLHELGRDDLDDQFFKQNYTQITEEAQCNLHAYLQQIFYLATTNPDLLRRSQTLLEGDFLPLLVNCFSPEINSRLHVYPFRRSVMMQQAEDFILAHLDRPLTLQDICQAIKVSKSALSYGFQEIFGMSPMVYLKIGD